MRARDRLPIPRELLLIPFEIVGGTLSILGMGRCLMCSPACKQAMELGRSLFAVMARREKQGMNTTAHDAEDVAYAAALRKDNVAPSIFSVLYYQTLIAEIWMDHIVEVNMADPNVVVCKDW